MKPSNLIKLALKDLRKCEKDPRYVVNMNAWHWPNRKRKCEICLAGAIMSQTKGCPIKQDTTPVDFGKVWEERFEAVDCFRIGEIRYGLSWLGIDREFDDITVPAYEEDRDGFYEAMKEIITLLKENGL